MGYANAYDELGLYREALDMALRQESFTAGLTPPRGELHLHKNAHRVRRRRQMAAKLGDREAARAHLTRTLTVATAFDAVPDYSMKHVRFTHGVEEQTAFDDCGETAMDAIRASLHSESPEADAMLTELWREWEDGGESSAPAL